MCLMRSLLGTSSTVNFNTGTFCQKERKKLHIKLPCDCCNESQVRNKIRECQKKKTKRNRTTWLCMPVLSPESEYKFTYNFISFFYRPPVAIHFQLSLELSRTYLAYFTCLSFFFFLLLLFLLCA